MRFMKKALVFCAASIIAFTVIMIVVYCVTGGVPDSLVTAFFATFGGEVLITGAIRIFVKDEEDQ